MESSRSVLSGGSNRPIREAVLYGRALLLAFTVYSHPLFLSAQPVAGGITSHSLPFSGSFIDATGNVYSASSATGTSQPVTPGAAQTQGAAAPGLAQRSPKPSPDATW